MFFLFNQLFNRKPKKCFCSSMNFIAKAFPVLTQDLSLKYGKKNQMILWGYPSLQVVLRLFYISNRITVPVGVVRALPTEWKLKISVMSAVISSTESKYRIRVGKMRMVSFDCALNREKSIVGVEDRSGRSDKFDFNLIVLLCISQITTSTPL